jgi:TolB-like protein/DNA-binding winged helix-turn-helix (wHTH) protein/Tfp pilus assembly protein PilF
MPQKTKAFYTFGPFTLDSQESVLTTQGERVPLTPKAFATLLVLVERSGHVIEKDEILKLVWPDTFVEEGTLAQNISTLRKALGDGTNGQTYIETIPRRGYRFVAPVKAETEERAAAIIPSNDSSPVSSSRFRMAAWTAFILIALLGTGGYLSRGHLRRSAHLSTSRATLAVLPFENLSSAPDQQYFADGFTEEMIAQLGDLDPAKLAIIARVSAMQYKGAGKNARDIGQELGADYILQGSVTRDGDRVRITAQLIQTQDQTTLWARDYDRDVRDILLLQSEVATAIASEIKLKLSPEESARLAIPRSVDPNTYELYLKGRYFWNKRGEANFVTAIDYFQQAIANDPKYAPAYAGLADAYALLGSSPNPSIPRSEAMPRAKAAAMKALQFDESLADAHTSLAFVKMHYEWDWPGSQKEFQRALNLNPNYATAHEWYAFWFTAQGRTDQALEQLAYAQKADPLSLIIKADTAEILNYSGRYAESQKEAQKALDMDPNFLPAYLCLADVQVGTKNYQSAVTDLQKALSIVPDDSWTLARLGATYALAGERKKAETILQGMLRDSKNRGDLTMNIAQIYSVLGENDQALVYLEKAYEYREGGLILMNVRHEFQNLHSDPRFVDLTHRVGLPAPRR